MWRTLYNHTFTISTKKNETPKIWVPWWLRIKRFCKHTIEAMSSSDIPNFTCLVISIWVRYLFFQIRFYNDHGFRQIKHHREKTNDLASFALVHESGLNFELIVISSFALTLFKRTHPLWQEIQWCDISTSEGLKALTRNTNIELTQQMWFIIGSQRLFLHPESTFFGRFHLPASFLTLLNSMNLVNFLLMLDNFVNFNQSKIRNYKINKTTGQKCHS